MVLAATPRQLSTPHSSPTQVQKLGTPPVEDEPLPVVPEPVDPLVDPVLPVVPELLVPLPVVVLVELPEPLDVLVALVDSAAVEEAPAVPEMPEVNVPLEDPPPSRSGSVCGPPHAPRPKTTVAAILSSLLINESTVGHWIEGRKHPADVA
jgi:hypothetical protein